MQEICFYLNSKTLEGMDLSKIHEDNPGIAGSEYEFLLVSYLLESRENGINPYLLANFHAILPHKNYSFVSNLDEACKFCIKKNIGEIVVDAKYFNKTILDKYGDKLSVYIWAHNTVTYELLDVFSRSCYIKKIINVGREQMELYRDHLATLKSTYIYNILPIKPKDFYKQKISNISNHNVVFIGSITKPKGFHLLAKAWKQILEKVPDAQLYVIGSGKLYNSNAKLGRYGLAEEDYEEEFIHYLTDYKTGELLPSVHLLGILGQEKYDVLGKCKVGVPNPSGVSETFCISGIEMQLMGCNIATILHPAYLDTVMNKKYLYKSVEELADYVVSRLNDASDDYDCLYHFVSSNFGIENNIQKWENLILGLSNNTIESISNYNYQSKKIKDILLRVKMHCPFFSFIPPVQLWYSLYNKYFRR